MNLEASMRKAAKDLLNQKKVDLIIGYEAGSLPLRTTPCFIRKPNDVEKLVLNPTCDDNLARYLLDREEKRIGIVAKGCDTRSILVVLSEKQIPRENMVIIGVPCLGVINRRKIEAEVGSREILEASVTNEEVTVSGEGFSRTLKTDDLLCDECTTCEHRNPLLYDVLVGREAPELTKVEAFAEVSSFEAKSAEEKWTYFKEEFKNCIRCYACRNACPLCYCKECFVDLTTPLWLGKTDNPSDVMVFHIVRALHVAGRCVDCGACSRACPMGIK
nr:4Fe-4S ferredoxin [Nitrososphaeria archaeon]